MGRAPLLAGFGVREVMGVVEVAAAMVAATVVAAAVVGEVLVAVESVGGVNPTRLGGRRFVFSDSHHCLHLSDDLHAFSHDLSIHEPAAEVPMVRVLLLASASLASLNVSMNSRISST